MFAGYWEYPWIWYGGIPLVALLLGWYVWRRRGEVSTFQLWISGLLRAAVMLTLVALAAIPTWTASDVRSSGRDQVILLLDSSASMGIEDEPGTTRYRQALDFLRRAIPLLEQQGWRVQVWLFDQRAESVEGTRLGEVEPRGSQTNLAGAIAAAIEQTLPPPASVWLLTDGVATVGEDNARAAHALVRHGVPVVAIGFGADRESKRLSLESLVVPARVPTGAHFVAEATVNITGSGPTPELTVLLFRDGQLVDQKVLKPTAELNQVRALFPLQESHPGRYRYTARLLTPPGEQVKVQAAEVSAFVDVSDEDRIGVLFVQGGLTWDYKFIQLALRSDPTLRIAALSRTSAQTRFLQSITDGGAALEGVPGSAEALADYRVVVLSNLNPDDLADVQQQSLLEFVSQYGGGLLWLGGGETFQPAWRRKPLEKLMPVVLSSSARGYSVTPFPLQLTAEGKANPVFHISQRAAPEVIWQQAPRFRDYAIFAGVKPGASVWAVRRSSDGQEQPLVVAHRYGLGRVLVIGTANWWRWRLAKETNTVEFDRFWQQLFHYLAGMEQGTVAIRVVDPWVEPNQDIAVELEQRPIRGQASPALGGVFRVRSDTGRTIFAQPVTLPVERSIRVSFRVEKAGSYVLEVEDPAGRRLGVRSLEVEPLRKELARTSRDMHTLKQWAQLSRGMALRHEEISNVNELLEILRQQAGEAYQQRTVRRPSGISWPVLLALLVLAGSEWLLRRRWRWS